MKIRKLQIITLTILLTLSIIGTASACEGLPEEVSTLMEEWEQAGVKTDCTVNQVLNWAVTHASNPNDSGAVMTEAMNFLSALGYDTARGTPVLAQASIDSYRKNGGVAKAFASWKGSQASVIYIPEKKQYITVQYRNMEKNEASGFTVKYKYGSNFSAEQKQMIEEAVGWWKDRIGDNFEIMLDISLDPNLRAGGTTLVGNVPRSCIDHQPGYAQIKLKEVNTSLVSHEIGHALGIGTAAVFGKTNVCGRLAEVAKSIDSIQLSSARIEDGKFFGNISKGVVLVRDSDGSYGHVASDETDDDGNHSAVQPGLGGKPSLKDLRILEDLGYEIK